MALWYCGRENMSVCAQVSTASNLVSVLPPTHRDLLLIETRSVPCAIESSTDGERKHAPSDPWCPPAAWRVYLRGNSSLSLQSTPCTDCLTLCFRPRDRAMQTPILVLFWMFSVKCLSLLWWPVDSFNRFLGLLSASSSQTGYFVIQVRGLLRLRQQKHIISKPQPPTYIPFVSTYYDAFYADNRDGGVDIILGRIARIEGCALSLLLFQYTTSPYSLLVWITVGSS